jgi:hypothetical protein
VTVWTPGYRSIGALSALGGVLALVASVPTHWFGPMPTDSYVFDPPRFSALWIERTVVPVLSVVAALLFLTGLLALFFRDREGMARWQRWLAVVTLIGAGAGTLATVILVSTVGAESADPSGVLNALVGVGFALLALALAVPGLLGWGTGYLRAGRSTLGTALAGSPILVVLIVAAGVVLDVEAGGFGAVPAVLPVAAAMVVVGYDLRDHPGKP